MAGPGLIIAGFALLAVVAGGGGGKTKTKPIGPGGLPPVNKTPNAWGLVGCDPYHTPSGKTSPVAVPGYATHPDYQWCYVVRDGDSAGSITEMFWNSKDGWRYAELLAANPQKLTKGTTISPDGVGEELNFASIEPGETLFLPRTWNKHIDQTGVPASKYVTQAVA